MNIALVYSNVKWYEKVEFLYYTGDAEPSDTFKNVSYSKSEYIPKKYFYFILCVVDKLFSFSCGLSCMITLLLIMYINYNGTNKVFM